MRHHTQWVPPVISVLKSAPLCSVQLEAQCFSQQEQLDSLQDQLETERELAETKRAALEKELALRVDQVRVSPSSDC